jgi:hypothetical protein
MTNRREFVRGIAWSTLGALSAKHALASGTDRAPPHSVAKTIAIADSTFTAASAEFAAEAARHGLDTLDFAGDVGGLWLREIEPALRTGATALAGLTGPGVLFCLETMTRAHGFAVVFRAERPERSGEGFPRVAGRHALAAAAASAHGGAVLEPFEHTVRPGSNEPPLFAWAIARDARRPAVLLT